MKLASNTETPFPKAGVGEYTEQVAAVVEIQPEVEQEDLTINFFIIGGVINIVMIFSYFIWAFRQWKKIDKRKQQERLQER